MKTLDAKRRIDFTITPADVKRGKRKDAFDCAAARALKRKLHAKTVEVRRSRTYVEMGNGTRQRFETPIALRTEVVAIDRGGKFAPGDYVLKPIPPSQQPAAIKARNRAAKKRTGPVKQRRSIPDIRGRA